LAVCGLAGAPVKRDMCTMSSNNCSSTGHRLYNGCRHWNAGNARQKWLSRVAGEPQSRLNLLPFMVGSARWWPCGLLPEPPDV
jgi:hypothetical protein